MDHIIAAAVLAAAGALVVIVSLTAGGVTPDGRIRAVIARAESARLPVTSKELGDRIGARIRRQNRLALWSLAATIPLSIPVILAAGGGSRLLMFLPGYLVMAGWSIGLSVAAVATRFRVDPGEPRVARVVRPTRRGSPASSAPRAATTPTRSSS
ncbi:hypothetical protein [Agromyces archimandritae]|uniref:Uncharacterized protein n=1 Tax=Agromyces archimandritae TaxID=2781962 RepID=A0A975IP11_9MICO|nr:hypothetical protein [Agromyces archimandritae]QTX03471.1 hypothetical protein G127AT_08865 [Agromyces archimandritae]